MYILVPRSLSPPQRLDSEGWVQFLQDVPSTGASPGGAALESGWGGQLGTEESNLTGIFFPTLCPVPLQWRLNENACDIVVYNKCIFGRSPVSGTGLLKHLAFPKCWEV